MERARVKRLSAEQRDAMLAYLKQHPKLMKGRGKAEDLFSQKHDSWTALAKILNNIKSGPRKTVDRWLKSFQDWKTIVKAKQLRISQKEQAGSLTHQEIELLRLMQNAPENFQGDPLEPSFPVMIDEEEPIELKPSISDLNESDSRTMSSPEPDAPRARRKRKRQHDNNCNPVYEREDRAIMAMEQQASSLDRMATAMEKMAEAVTVALERFTNASNANSSREFQ